MSYKINNVDILYNTALLGTPTAPTPTPGDNSTKIATTEFVNAQGYAKLNSPEFTGIPTTPTPTQGDNSTKISTTAFVNSQVYLNTATTREPGVYLMDGGNNTYEAQNPYNIVPLYYSTPSLGSSSGLATVYTEDNRFDFFDQSTGQGRTSATRVGTYYSYNMSGKNDIFYIHPGWGIIGYNATSYGGSVVLNYKNTTTRIVSAKANGTNNIISIKIYYNDTEITSY
jgi:hypothetical protein